MARIWLLAAALVLLLGGCNSDKDKEQLNEQGYALYEQGAFEEAIVLFSEAIAKYPDYGDYYTNRGMAYYEQGDVQSALNDLDQAIRLSQYAPEAYVNRGTVYLGIGEYLKASEDFYSAISQKEHFHQPLGLYYAYLNLGTLLNQMDQPDQALTVLELAEAKYNQDPSLYNAMGLLYRSTGQYEESLEAFNNALRLDQDYAYAYGNRASVYYLLEDYTIALSDVNTALDMDRYVPQFYDLKAKIHLALGQDAQVEKTVELGLSIWESYSELYMIRGSLYMNQERYTEALMQYGLAVQYQNTEGYLGQAVGYRMIKDYEGALGVLEKYLEDKPESIEARMEKGLSLQLLKRDEEAILVFDEVLTMAPETWDALYYKALSYEAMTDYATAKQLLKEVIDNDPEHKEAIKELAFLQEHY